MPYMTGRAALLALLKQEGITHMFGNPGTTELPLMDQMAGEHDIHHRCTGRVRHELDPHDGGC